MLLHLLLRRLTQTSPCTTRRTSPTCRLERPVAPLESPCRGFEPHVWALTPDATRGPLSWRTRDASWTSSASIDANFFGDDASDFTDLSPRQTCRPVGKPAPRVEPYVWASTAVTRALSAGGRVDLPSASIDANSSGTTRRTSPTCRLDSPEFLQARAAGRTLTTRRYALTLNNRPCCSVIQRLPLMFDARARMAPPSAPTDAQFFPTRRVGLHRPVASADLNFAGSFPRGRVGFG